MTFWQELKHFIGFHGKHEDNEWLDARFFDGECIRQYHCRTCKAIYGVRVKTDIYPSHDYELQRLRAMRDADKAR